jgi:hypothetical protein
MIKMKDIILESLIPKTLIIVDIQPEYKQFFRFGMTKLISFLNREYQNFREIVILYNGKDTLGMISENEYKMWLLENGLDEIILDGVEFYDKGYTWFRYCMDNGIDEDIISNFIRFLYQNNIHDSREMDRDKWAKYLRQYRQTDKKIIYNLLARCKDYVHVPDLMDFLKNKNNILLTGGGLNECLKEVEISLKALKKPYTILKEFTY